MTTVEINKTVFNDIYWRFLHARQHIQIFYGGSGSGKSFFLAQRAVNDLLQGQRNYLILRNVARTSRQSTFTEVQKVIFDWGVSALFKINKSDLTITCQNGQQAIFAGLDDVDKLKSVTPIKGVFTDVWLEEATEAQETDVLQLERRMRGRSRVPKRIALSFNPILRAHWIYKRFFQHISDDQQISQDDDKLILKTIYRDNRFLTDQDVKILEDTTDEYFYNVYTLGNWGVLGDVIFKNWKIEEVSREGLDKFRYGLDFGFTNDPAAFVELVLDPKHKKIYILDEFYELKLTNPELAHKIKPIAENAIVWCDSAEPKSIEELKRHKVNARGATKGKDSVLYGIQWLQQHEIIIDSKCQNTINEFRSYQWQKIKTGETINKPVDRNNHVIDATRYAFSLDMDAKNRKAGMLFSRGR